MSGAEYFDHAHHHKDIAERNQEVGHGKDSNSGAEEEADGGRRQGSQDQVQHEEKEVVHSGPQSCTDEIGLYSGNLTHITTNPIQRPCANP